MRRIARDKAQQEIPAAADHVAFAHLRPGSCQRFKCIQHALLLRFQADEREEHHLPAQRGGVYVGVVAANDGFFFQPAHTAQARWGGKIDAARKLHIRDAAILLEFRQNLAVQGIQGRLGGGFHGIGHRPSLLKTGLPRNIISRCGTGQAAACPKGAAGRYQPVDFRGADRG